MLGLGILLGACAAGPPGPDVPPAGPEAFQIGYLDGCASGYTDANRPGYETRYRKDARRYAADPDYHRGWDQGHRICYAHEIRFPHMCFGPETLNCP
jgi:hypothetical protein